MSILCPSNVRANAKRTRPARIRPVPPTFAAGLFEDDEPLPPEFVARMRQIEEEEALWDREHSRALSARPPREPYPVTSASLDSARRFGYRVGYSGHEATPQIVANEDEREAYLRGHAEGERDRDREEIAAFERWCAEREMDGPDVWGDPAEYAVAGLVGFAD